MIFEEIQAYFKMIDEQYKSALNETNYNTLCALLKLGNYKYTYDKNPLNFGDMIPPHVDVPAPNFNEPISYAKSLLGRIGNKVIPPDINKTIIGAI